MVSHENFITFNCNYVYIKYFNHRFNFCVSKSFYYSTDDALLRKAFTDILNCCDIHFTYILFPTSYFVHITQNRKLEMFLQYLKKKVSQLLFCFIVMQNIQIFYRGPVMFVITFFLLL